MLVPCKTLMNPDHFDYTMTVDDKEYKGNTSMLVSKWT